MYSRTGERFSIYADEKAVLTVNLKKQKKGYTVSHLLLNTEIGIDIKVPKGFTVYLNDIEVSKSGWTTRLARKMPVLRIFSACRTRIRF